MSAHHHVESFCFARFALVALIWSVVFRSLMRPLDRLVKGATFFKEIGAQRIFKLEGAEMFFRLILFENPQLTV